MWEQSIVFVFINIKVTSLSLKNWMTEPEKTLINSHNSFWTQVISHFFCSILPGFVLEYQYSLIRKKEEYETRIYMCVYWKDLDLERRLTNFFVVLLFILSCLKYYFFLTLNSSCRHPRERKWNNSLSQPRSINSRNMCWKVVK